MPEPTPWSLWLAHGVRAFGLTPAQFWRLSLREWRALNHPAEQPMSRGDFAALAARYPD